MMSVTIRKKNRARKSFGEGCKQRFETWLLQHAQVLFSSFGQYIRNPISNLLTTAVIGISLALPFGFYIMLDNVRRVSSAWDDSLQFTLFLQNEITDEQVVEFADKLKKHDKISEVSVIKRVDVLAEYQRLIGFTDALDALGENPFPDVVIVKPTLAISSEVETKALIAEFKAMWEVDSAQYDNRWIKRFLYLLDIVDRAIIILASLLAIAVLLIVGNTIRLAIYNRRSEIEITKLFGGTDAFIRRPFLYSGFWYGLFGSVIAWFLIAFSLYLLREPTKQLANLYASDFELIGLRFPEILILLGIGIGLGLLSSWIAVKRHLQVIEPG